MNPADLNALHLHLEVDRLNAGYAAALDAPVGSDAFNAWADCFTEDCLYKVTSRENADRGFPLALMAYESKGMLKDRLYGVVHTLYHGPYYQRHVVSPARLLPAGADDPADSVRARASFAVFRTKPGQASEVYLVGEYRDLIVRTDSGLQFKERVVVYDTEMILNSLIYPV
jgi:salicylate 5-hydroxylase small subunit